MGFKNKQENMSFSYSKKTFIASLFLICTMLAGTVQASSATHVLGLDTVAGNSTLLKAVNFPPETQIVFVITTPDGTQIRQMQRTDTSGTANATLDGLHTTKSGKYVLSAETSAGMCRSLPATFSVLAAELSGRDSTFEADRTVVSANGSETVNLTARLVDRYGNPLEARAVKIFSSRESDIFEPAVKLSDFDGVAEFSYRPSAPGLVTLMALDTTSDQLILSRVSLSVLNDRVTLANAGGDYPSKAHAATFGPLAGFEIESIPDTVSRNENVSFTVKAIDEDDQVVEDYTGTIRFSVEGENSSAVTLPDNYKFLATDLGVHTFSLGLSFAENGTYKLVVTDLTDKFKTGEKTVIVGSTAGTQPSGTTITENPLITMPAAGTYSQAEQTIGGTAKAGTTITIFDNDAEIGSVPVGPTGRFSYQTSPLSDGKHVIYVVSQDMISLEIIGTSETVEINIDTEPPKIEELRIEPNTEIVPGSVINVSVFTEKNLSQAALIFNYDIIELNAKVDDDSVYVGSLQAPAEPGEYKVSVLLVDELQNEVTYQDAATVNVSAEGGTVQTDLDTGNNGQESEDLNQPEQGQVVMGAPSQVGGLIAYGLDGRVTLVWDAATDDTMVKFYRVYFGDSLQSMTGMVDTKDASTTWYVPNLENGKEYFFAVTAVDDQGNESPNKSEIVSGIPFVLEIRNALSEEPVVPLEQPDLHSAAYSGPYPVRTTDSGPGVLLLLGGSIAAALTLRRRR